VIGELRDLETIEMAVSAAETGHLVIGTMHTSDAATTLNRLLDVFPAAQQTQIRASVAESLRGIVCQRLLPGQKAGGLVMACEILVNNVAISNLVREGKTTGLRNTMETGLREGMCLMDNVIFGLYKEGKVSKETALGENLEPRAARQDHLRRHGRDRHPAAHDGGKGRLGPAPHGGPAAQGPDLRLHHPDRGPAAQRRRHRGFPAGDRARAALEGLPRAQATWTSPTRSRASPGSAATSSTTTGGRRRCSARSRRRSSPSRS
jgi:hypothetical protein